MSVIKFVELQENIENNLQCVVLSVRKYRKMEEKFTFSIFLKVSSNTVLLNLHILHSTSCLKSIF